jgi:hypothetical protein
MEDGKRDPERISTVLKSLEKIWRRHPDWRLGQLIANIADWADETVWDLDEDSLLAEIERHLAGQNDASQTELQTKE